MQRRLICTMFGAICLAGCTNGGDKSPGAAITAQPVNAAQIVVVRQESQDVASDALGAFGPTAVPALATALQDGDPGVRIEACRSLAYMGAGAKDAVPQLTGLLNDQEESVRQEAAKTLGQIGPPAQPAIPELMQMLRTKQ